MRIEIQRWKAQKLKTLHLQAQCGFLIWLLDYFCRYKLCHLKCFIRAISFCDKVADNGEDALQIWYVQQQMVDSVKDGPIGIMKNSCQVFNKSTNSRISNHYKWRLIFFFYITRTSKINMVYMHKDSRLLIQIMSTYRRRGTTWTFKFLLKFGLLNILLLTANLIISILMNSNDHLINVIIWTS